ncbi:hypothetical protein GIB67_007444 [Kingdonia uniflora]|uniref:Aminotransferase-like plant mobile domain-containing protein n=1 Tax=Kingdonia uniflora TaxID=39325 RepID=A0A7J7P3L9_9MAGN|nr:hypothetical protein GIB67_007444 [Kingdonia uniflora]
MGFEEFLSINVGNRNNQLVHALVEWWWPSTHTFYFPCGELGFTPLDFVMLTGLPCIIGLSLPYDDMYSNVEEASKLFLGITSNDIKYGNITLVFLKMYMRDLDLKETDYAYNPQLDIVYARAFISYMMGNLFFTNCSTSLTAGYIAAVEGEHIIGTVLPVLEPGQNLVVTSSSRVRMRINYVSIRSPDVMYNLNIVPHSVFFLFHHLYLVPADCKKFISDDVASVIGDDRYIFQEERLVVGSCASYEKDGTCIAAAAPAISISFVGGHSILHETLKVKEVPAIFVNFYKDVFICVSTSRTALVGILEKGSLPSLYVGLGAILWRNIPHSIIKLLCGGLAGSTAALFTTPFDVVKTRLHTEELWQQNSILQHATYEDSRHYVDRADGIDEQLRRSQEIIQVTEGRLSEMFIRYETEQEVHCTLDDSIGRGRRVRRGRHA